MDENVIAAINALILLDIAATQAYEVAINTCTIKELRDQLQEFRVDHERHVRELSEQVKVQGGEPAEGPDDNGRIITGYTALSSQEDRGAILAMRGNEELTNNAYASALQSELPEDIRALIELNFQDERRHIAWLRETIEIRGWNREPTELRELLRSGAEAAE